MAASNNNSSNNNINNGSLVGDQGSDNDNNNNNLGKGPTEADNEGLADNSDTTGSPGGEETVADTVEEVGGAAAALPDDDVEMENIEEVEQPIHDIVKAVQVALEGHNGQMAQRYPDAMLRGYTAMFPDGTKNIFLALYTATVKDVNDMLDQYFGEDAVFLGFMDNHHVIRATPSSLVHDIVGLRHIRLGFGFGAESPDDGD